MHNHSCSVAALNSLLAPTLLVVISHLKPGASRCLLGLLPELAQGALPGPASCMFPDGNTLSQRCPLTL